MEENLQVVWKKGNNSKGRLAQLVRAPALHHGCFRSKLSSDFIDNFGDRNVLSVAEAFGESFLYYSTRNPAIGRW